MAEQEDEDAPIWQTALKWGLIAGGGVMGLYMVGSLLYPLFVIGVLGGAGYFAARWLKGQKALPSGGSNAKGLPMSNDEFESKMRELDALEKRYDRDID